MGKIFIMTNHSGGGGGTDTSVVTATASDVLIGKIIVDAEGESVIGTMPDNTTTTSNGTVPGINSTYASIPTREGTGLQYGIDTAGTARISLCPPQGYYQGGSASYVNRPAADFGNAATNQVISGATFTSSNGLKLTGTVAVQSVLSFNAAPYSTNQITFTWKNPAKGAFSGVIICGRSDGTYPTSPTDNRWYKGNGNNATANGTSTYTIGGLTPGTKYYIKAFSYALKNNAEWVHATTYTATVTTTARGTQTFTSSGTFTVPANVRSIDIFCLGGGGSGGGCGETSQGNPSCAGGGGGGYTATKKAYAVTPGATFAVTVGAGGASKAGHGNTGGTTSFGSVLSAAGGYGGRAWSEQKAIGGNGGSGGGGATSLSKVFGGGSDGGDGLGGSDVGISNANTFKGKGQGSTTRAFAESSNTLYAGGGAGDSTKASGTGGAGGGGSSRSAGSANTGGGGGGYGSNSTSDPKGPAGGSGICIIRWGY